MKLAIDDILPIIYRFLIKSGFTKAAGEIQKAVDDDLSKVKFPLHKKKLMNIMKKYVKDFPELITSHKDEEEVVEEEVIEEVPVVEKKNKNKKKKAMRKVSNVSITNLNEELEVENEVHSNGLLGKRRKSSAIVNNDQEVENKPKKKKKTQVIEKLESVEDVQKAPTAVKDYSNPRIKINPVTASNLNKRVKIESMNDVTFMKLKDNSYATKIAAGGIDEYGKFGWDRLGGEQGKNFRKEKTKLKNRAFAGEKIVFCDNSLA